MATREAKTAEKGERSYSERNGEEAESPTCDKSTQIGVQRNNKSTGVDFLGVFFKRENMKRTGLKMEGECNGWKQIYKNMYTVYI